MGWIRTDIAVVQRHALGGINLQSMLVNSIRGSADCFGVSYKGHRSFSRTVSNTEQIHACDCEPNPDVAFLLGISDSKGDGDQCVADCHEREGRQKQTSPAERVDCPECRQCEDEVDDAEAEGAQQGSCWVRSCS